MNRVELRKGVKLCHLSFNLGGRVSDPSSRFYFECSRPHIVYKKAQLVNFAPQLFFVRYQASLGHRTWLGLYGCRR